MSEQPSPPYQAATSSSDESTPAGRLRALLARAELSQRGAAKMLGVDERTMRMWCAGQGTAPTSVYRALDPRLTDSEHLRYRIEQNQQLIELLEGGRAHELPRAYQPVDAESTKREVTRLRSLNDRYRAMLRWEEAMQRMRDAGTEVFLQSLTTGGYGLTLAHIQEFDEAKQELQDSAPPAHHIIERICDSHVLGALRHRATKASEKES